MSDRQSGTPDLRAFKSHTAISAAEIANIADPPRPSAFAAEDCRIMLTARSTDRPLETETAVRATGAEVAAYAADVGSPDDAARLTEATVAVYGGVDILINNVGGGGGGARVADSSDDDWRGADTANSEIKAPATSSFVLMAVPPVVPS